MTQHTDSSRSSRPSRPSEETQVTLHGPADLAEALPYLMGFHPDDSIVMIALHGARGRFGGRLRLGIPADAAEWPDVAAQLADCLIQGAGRRGRPDAIAVYLCQDPLGNETPLQTMERLRPLAQHLRTACGSLDVPVVEALCISAGRWWSYCCPDTDCCPPDGGQLTREGTSVMAAAAAYAGIQVRGSLREMEARLAPLGAERAAGQERALDAACAELLPRLLAAPESDALREQTIALASSAMERFRDAPVCAGRPADDADDELITDDEAAALILGLQDRGARDRVAEWMEEPDAAAALRLWRALARRCVGAYTDHAAPPLTLAGWVSWSLGDEPAARVAFGRALDADPDYTFAKLLHQACNHGLDPEPLRRSLREERCRRARRSPRPLPGADARPTPATGPAGRPVADGRPEGRPSGRRRHRRSGRTGRPGTAGGARGPEEGAP
ncbi:DUF4192 domain-containing protein [Streptomyces sp. RB6PN25]|uniref:DUF4192 domain-containing protein n=1 Tax=Streptomyces humicola TaxID=2953240 RepID=A0ABT1PZ86_9ACTN|nr:DUF4192 domain-containing protein [Streptomyces humicola]MCQ4082981.1 DUF4192 domain-containing protein [Streptomyces humicola]